MTLREPALELVEALGGLRPGRALDVACGPGRHAFWLAERGWQVTAVDRTPESIPGVEVITADLERGVFTIEPNSWDLIVCWLYWQPDLLPQIAAGVRPGGTAAIAGKTNGRFAVSLQQLRAGFIGWSEVASGESEVRAFLIVRRD